MIEKLKKLKNLRKIGKVGLVITSLLFLQSISFASSIQDSVLVTGTTKLINDLTSWLLILAPVLTILLIGYFFLRKAVGDEMDSRRWDNRIKIAVMSCIGVILASALVSVITGYYQL